MEHINPPWNDKTIDDKLDHSLKITGSKISEGKKVRRFLNYLNKNEITEYHRQHSIRVGLLSREIAKHIHLDEKELLFAGTLHDIGKCCIAQRILSKADYRLGGDSSWSHEDSFEIKKHTIIGYDMLKDDLPFTADIIVRHHSFKTLDPYPEILPPFSRTCSNSEKAIITFYARLVAVADIYDAFHRLTHPDTVIDNSFIRKRMFEENKDVKELVENLYKVKIFV